MHLKIGRNRLIVACILIAAIIGTGGALAQWYITTQGTVTVNVANVGQVIIGTGGASPSTNQFVSPPDPMGGTQTFSANAWHLSLSHAGPATEWGKFTVYGILGNYLSGSSIAIGQIKVNMTDGLSNPIVAVPIAGNTTLGYTFTLNGTLIATLTFTYADSWGDPISPGGSGLLDTTTSTPNHPITLGVAQYPDEVTWTLVLPDTFPQTNTTYTFDVLFSYVPA